MNKELQKIREELEKIKMLLVLSLTKKEAPVKEIAKAAGIGDNKITEMFPQNRKKEMKENAKKIIKKETK